MKSERRIAYRKQVAALLEAVLDDSISAREAINCWPGFCNRDTSVQCAYTMLWYWEADEDRRWQEMLYSDVQYQQLRDCTEILKAGLPLPPNVMMKYLGQLAPQEFSESTLWSRPMTILRQLFGASLAIWRQSLQAAFGSALVLPHSAQARRPAAISIPNAPPEVSMSQLQRLSRQQRASSPSSFSARHRFLPSLVHQVRTAVGFLFGMSRPRRAKAESRSNFDPTAWSSSGSSPVPTFSAPSSASSATKTRRPQPVTPRQQFPGLKTRPTEPWA